MVGCIMNGMHMTDQPYPRSCDIGSGIIETNENKRRVIIIGSRLNETKAWALIIVGVWLEYDVAYSW